MTSEGQKEVKKSQNVKENVPRPESPLSADAAWRTQTQTMGGFCYRGAVFGVLADGEAM